MLWIFAKNTGVDVINSQIAGAILYMTTFQSTIAPFQAFKDMAFIDFVVQEMESDGCWKVKTSDGRFFIRNSG